MGTLKRELSRLNGAVGKLSKRQRAVGVGAGWLILWRWVDDSAAACAAFPLGTPKGAGDLVVCHRHAGELGIDTNPDVQLALNVFALLLATQKNPPPGTSWREHDLLAEMVGDASCAAASPILKALGCPDGPLGQTPIGGRPPAKPVAATADEVAMVLRLISTPPLCEWVDDEVPGERQLRFCGSPPDPVT